MWEATGQNKPERDKKNRSQGDKTKQKKDKGDKNNSTSGTKNILDKRNGIPDRRSMDGTKLVRTKTRHIRHIDLDPLRPSSPLPLSFLSNPKQHALVWRPSPSADICPSADIRPLGTMFFFHLPTCSVPFVFLCPAIGRCESFQDASFAGDSRGSKSTSA